MKRNGLLPLIANLLMVICLLAITSLVGGCAGERANTGQLAGQPNGENLNVQGNYYRYVNLNIDLTPAVADALADSKLVSLPPIFGGVRIKNKDSGQDISSQPANSGGSKGGDVAADNQIPIPIGQNANVNTPTQNNSPTSNTGGASSTPAVTSPPAANSEASSSGGG